jgi:hypothetical protein
MSAIACCGLTPPIGASNFASKFGGILVGAGGITLETQVYDWFQERAAGISRLVYHHANC